MSNPRDVAVLVGSLRKESFTRKIALALAAVAPPTLALSIIEIGELPHYNQELDEAKTPPAPWVAFRDRVRRADAVLFATPEYNRSIPAPLKNAVDVGSRPFGKSVYRAKPCAIASCSPGQYGGFGANHHLRQSCVFLDMPVMQQPELYLAHVDKLLDENGKVIESSRGHLEKFMNAFACWIDVFALSDKQRSAA